jgi:glycyl-radical enzyme activating protein
VSRIDGATAMIFGIQHLSLNDGPGIRTTIFFKGCPLRCKWCHNPESYSMQTQLSFNPMLCAGCLKCAEVCPSGVHNAVYAGGRPVHSVRHDLCTGCGKCMEVCCYGALELVGERYGPAQLLDRIRQDFPYYGIGGDKDGRGGITLSGGEPMLQAPFIEKLLELTGDIHICMETCGYADPEDYLRLAPRIGLFLFDYKATDPEKHRELCGTDNVLLLKNLDLLYRSGARIILRLPLIPSVNDDDGHLAGIAGLLEKYPGILRAEIMAYHNMGDAKAENLGMAVPSRGLANAAEADKRNWITRLKELGARQDIIIG